MKSPTQLFLKTILKLNVGGIKMETLYRKLILQGIF